MIHSSNLPVDERHEISFRLEAQQFQIFARGPCSNEQRKCLTQSIDAVCKEVVIRRKKRRRSKGRCMDYNAVGLSLSSSESALAVGSLTP